MKNVVLFFVFSALSLSVHAERFKDHIHSVSESKSGREHLLYLSSGRVVFVNGARSPYYRPSDFQPGERVEIEVDRRQTLKSLTSLPPEKAPEEDDLEEGPVSQMDPTILPDFASAKRIFNDMNRSYKRDTECSDRAHVWAYEEWKQHDLRSNKVFLFFTNTYIRKYRYHWWFHVSPYTLVRENGNAVEYVMDKKYTSYPYLMKRWTDIFMRSNRACPVKTYSHYRSNRNGSEHCYLVKTSMFYRLPLHVRRMEDYGEVKTKFSTSEVNFSYRAFRRRESK